MSDLIVLFVLWPFVTTTCARLDSLQGSSSISFCMYGRIPSWLNLSVKGCSACAVRNWAGIIYWDCFAWILILSSTDKFQDLVCGVIFRTAENWRGTGLNPFYSRVRCLFVFFLFASLFSFFLEEEWENLSTLGIRIILAGKLKIFCSTISLQSNH